MQWNIFTVPPLVVGILMLILGFATLIRERASKISSSFFMATLSIFVWQASSAWLYSASSESAALFWAKLEHIGVVFIPSFFFLFTLAIVRHYGKYRFFGWATLIISGLFCWGIVLTPHLLDGVSLKSWGYYPRYGPLGFFIILYIGLFMMFSLDLIWLEFVQSTSERERSRLKGIFLGVAVGLFGAIDFLPILDIRVYPLGYIPLFMCTLIVGQTVLRFKLVDLTSSFAASRILDTMEGLVAVVDLEGRISTLNHSLCQVLGYSDRELKDKKISLLFDPGPNVFPRKIRKNWALLGEEMQWRRKDGTMVDMSVSASSIADRSGQPAGIVYVGTDITERKKTERELVQAKESAERANKAKSEFLANMSHEIRTPMNAVIGFADILEDTALSDIQKDYVDTIRESGKLLLALINDILDFSKIEAGQIELEEIDFNLQNLVEDVLKIARPKVTGTKIELYHHYDEEVPVYFKGDPTRIRQIILNLLNNAIKFTEEGEIGVRVIPGEEAGEKAPGDGLYTIQISVKDTGIGIPEDKRKTIFGTFTQADSSMTRRYGGTGLGLAITSALVARMGGKIGVDSEVGRGSEFLFTLKLNKSDVSAFAEISPLQTKKLKGKTVFIVDDNENARRLMKSYCEKAGLKILAVVSSSVEGLNELERMDESPDLILSDIMMPEMDGLEFARRLRGHQKFKETKLVAVSSDARPGSARAAKESGYDAFITKPVSERSVINILKTVLGDKRAEGQIVTTYMAEELTAEKIRVLVVDDNPVNQKLLRVLLEKLGCEKEVVSNGKEAVEVVMEKDFDLCLMDLHMPVMNGVEATKEIRTRGKTALPIIALTAAAFKEGKEQCLEAGMNDFLTQPVDPATLREKIREWTKKKNNHKF